MSSTHLPVPEEFSFDLCLQFLKRSPRELLHRATDDRVIKLLRVENELILFSVRNGKEKIIIDLLDGKVSALTKATLRKMCTNGLTLAQI